MNNIQALVQATLYLFRSRFCAFLIRNHSIEQNRVLDSHQRSINKCHFQLESHKVISVIRINVNIYVDNQDIGM